MSKGVKNFQVGFAYKVIKRFITEYETFESGDLLKCIDHNYSVYDTGDWYKFLSPDNKTHMFFISQLTEQATLQDKKILKNFEISRDTFPQLR